jgi:hypothetical protein
VTLSAQAYAWHVGCGYSATIRSKLAAACGRQVHGDCGVKLADSGECSDVGASPQEVERRSTRRVAMPLDQDSAQVGR